MRTVVEDDGIRISDCLWEQIESLIPKPIDNHPLKCHRKRIDNRKAMDAIFFVLRTGCQWEALDSTAICKHSVAHKRFQEWVGAGEFETFWARGLLAYDGLKEIFEEFKYRTHIRPRGEEKKQLKKGTLKKARRWVIERLGGWINKFRGLLIRWNKKAENYYAMLCFACGVIALRAALCG